MGVPKFFRWLSERYPAISRLLADNRIPEFDCLYLDMNGIIHNCTHSDSDSPTFRMSEDRMFIAMFNYIEHLFGKIKPQKLFFMAIDGVAPRAKMNQQRARRFRTARDAEQARDKAIGAGMEMPAEDAFDSNCITPGTEFFARLTKQLKYFVNKKVSEDVDWQGVEIVLSGHEVPGEGEHKIMEYIRQAKSQPNYDPNRRHCLYGLDADLIMLGLLSHDPHFCLLREEVKFGGRQNQKRSTELEHQNFYLLHLCMVREYLELEFQELAAPGALGFPFDMERVIDDFILMAFFVGNDFLPNLPHLHINEGALALMFNTYKAVLPKARGYINEQGTINLERMALLLDELSHVEYRHFESESADAAWFKGKRLEREDVMDRTDRKGELVVSPGQRQLLRTVANCLQGLSSQQSSLLDFPAELPARDRDFVQRLADDLRLQWSTVENDQGERHLRIDLPALDEINSDDFAALWVRVLQRYANAKIVDSPAEETQTAANQVYDAKFRSWKDEYYLSKFGWNLDNEEELRNLTENYVQGLQWVLYYYYRGIASWPWFYRYHYSPMISGRCAQGLAANLKFELGQPFKPCQQLMGVLPDRSKKIVPPAYRDLMMNPESPILDFYPRDFDLDMNGKQQEWEAVVKIPFIDEKRLLAAMARRDHLLTDDERSRNSFGVSLKFTYSKDVDYVYPSSLPGIFHDLPHCRCVENIFELPTMEGLEVYVGLMDGVQLGAAALAGFPSLKVLPFDSKLAFHGVSVFQQESRKESMVLTLSETESRKTLVAAKEKLGKAVHVGFPYLQEAKVVKVSDELFDYVLPENGPSVPVPVPHASKDIADWKKRAGRIASTYSKRLGILVGEVESLVHVEMLKGLKKTADGATIKEHAEIPGMEAEYAAQTIVDEVVSEDPRFLEKAALPLEEEFPVGLRAFFLGVFAYGRPSQVAAHDGNKVSIAVVTLRSKEPDFGRRVALAAEHATPYTPSFAVARRLKMPPLALSKLTASLSVSSGGQRLNLGLNLKFESKKMKVLGYSRKSSSGWEYSQKAIELIEQYMVHFPDFIAGVIQNPSGDIYDETVFYREDVARQKMKEIMTWLKSIESKSFVKVPLDAEQLDSDAVRNIEEAADRWRSGATFNTQKMKNIPRYALLKPGDAEQQTGNQKFAVGDRAVYVLDSGRVPIGAVGTVVGKTRTTRATLLDMVFDEPFMSGTSLGDRCSPFRGSTVPASSVLNLTDRQLVCMSTAATARRPQTTQQQPMAPRFGAPLGPGGAGQFVSATAPPPLTGSYSQMVVPVHNPSAAPRGGSAPRGARNTGGLGFRNASNNGSSNDGATGSRQGTSHATQTSALHQETKGLPREPSAGPDGVAAGYQGRASHKNGARAGGPKSQGSGSSSRGGPRNNAGFTTIEQDDPLEGVVANNPSFRPRSYHRVPPPASLNASQDSTGRGRGRGSGRGRRGGNGGRGNARAQPS